MNTNNIMGLDNLTVNDANNSDVVLPTEFETIPIPYGYEIALIIYLLVTAILAICGNSIILLVEANNRCKTSTDWLIMFMAANDMLCALINIPFYIIYHLGFWSVLGSDASCKLHYYIEQTTMFSSTLLLCIVAVDRYFKTCRPHQKFLTPKRTLRVCTIETVVACVVMSPTLIVITYDGSGFCSHIEIFGGLLSKLLPYIFLFAFNVMFVIVCVSYIRTAYAIKYRLISKIQEAPYPSLKEASQVTTSTTKCPDNTGRPKKKQSEPFSILFNRRKNKIIPVVSETNPKLLKLYTGLEGTISAGSDKVSGNGTHTHSKHRNQDQREISRRRPKLCNCCWKLLNGKHHKDIKSESETKTTSVPVARVPETRIHRTTKIMFIVTLVFLLSWIPTLAMFPIRRMVNYHKNLCAQVLALFARKAFLINTFTNPIFYIWMSSSFKERTKVTLESLLRCSKRR